ncbi:MAG: PHP domain-containing protein [Chloroflexi bacterium]|nr:PHP domain-containing protein [Chloroflexota bacterium]
MADLPSVVDLHLHTTASDGTLSPAELVALACEQGLACIAITDHDSTDAVAAAVAAAADCRPPLEVIPGVEMSTDVPGGEIHVLGYFLDPDNAEFQQVLADLRDSRIGRAQRMVQKLAELGVPVAWERVRAIAGEGAIGRPHIAQAMVEAGHVASFQDAFTSYLGRTGPAYAERRKLTPEEAVQLLVRAGGLPVLAHPADIADLEHRLPPLIAAGLVGMEVHYHGYDPAVITWLARVAAAFDLIPCGGSDFHGIPNTGGPTPGCIAVPYESVERLRALRK